MAADESHDDRTQTHVVLTKDTMVSHYQIVEKIGAGGMGEVFLAEDTKLHRKVALKFLPSQYVADADFKARFVREAEAMAKLNHPNIITIFDVSKHHGRPFIAMELVEGQSLRDLAKNKELSLDRIIELAIQVCEGLSAAHDKKIIHRDIKPSNIVIDAYGRPKILDFGLAAIQGAEHLTKTGSTLGTVRYMSPEQVQGQKVDHRSDLFSFGVVLYELISGRTPFEKDNEAATLKAIIQDNAEPLARYKSDIPDELQRTVSKLLEKDRSMRYQHADGVVSDLKRLLTPTQSSIAPLQAKKKSSLPLVIGGLVIIAILAVAGIKYWPTGEPAQITPSPPERKMLAVLPFENLGSADDDGFADGITDAITSRIAKISGLGVIARTSVLQYKGTTKRIDEIGAELGVGYILEGTILWDKSGDIDRVRIIPQLIQVSDESHLWAETYERAMTGIFEVQADIATTIAQNLDVTLLQPEREALAERPTENMEAYRAYLRVRQLSETGFASESHDTRIDLLEKAVALDPDFALAFAELSIVQGLIYHYGDRTEDRRKQSLAAVQEAFRLQPGLPEAHFAYGLYFYRYFRDYEKAGSEISIARRGLPNNSKVMAAQGTLAKRQGNFEEAIDYNLEALTLNPLNASTALEIAICYDGLRQYEKADEFYNLTISLRPDRGTTYTFRSKLYLLMGDIEGARRVLENCPERGEMPGAWYRQEVYQRNYEAAHGWLDSLLQDNSIDERNLWPTVLMRALTYWYQGKSNEALLAFDSSRAWLENKLTDSPDDYRLHRLLGITMAGLADTVRAVKHAKRAVELIPTSKDVLVGSELILSLAQIYSLLGNADEACATLEQLFELPSGHSLSVGLLRLDPNWDPIRNHPRFKALIEKYDQSK